MEAATVVATQAVDPPESHDGVAEATRSTAELFQWSGYVHVGLGAESCEHGLDGECSDPAHFHAWVCLLNQYQIRDVQEKARAARARKVRALRDPTSDSGAILEGELDDIRRDAMPELVRVVASRIVDSELYDIIRDVQERDEFEHQDADAEEFQRLMRVPEEDRTTEEGEELERLQTQMLDYAAAMEKIVSGRRDAEETRLRALDPDRLIDMEREHRIGRVADEMFLHTYYTWAIYVGAREPTAEGFPTKRKFREPNEQRDAPPEVVNALRDKIRALEQATTAEQRGDVSGNS